MTDRKPCPFCASPQSRIEHWDVWNNPQFRHTEYAVTCENCGACGPNDLGESGAVEMWNLRRAEFPKPYIEGAENEKVG